MPTASAFVGSFVSLRPRLYHLTAASNVESILSEGALHPAAHLLREAGETRLIRERRGEQATIEVRGRPVHIRDQAPLHPGNMALGDGWSLADFVAHLNEHVFFWPGTTAGPSDYGRRHFERYQAEPNAVLVLDAARLIAANTEPGVRLCRYNSGSPRCNAGRPSPRGKATFVPPAQFEGGPGAVVEVVFRGSVRLGSALIVVSTPGRFIRA